MKKEYAYCLISIAAVILGTVFAICGVILQSNPLSRKSALLILSIVLVVTGAAAFAVNYRKYHIVTNLCRHKVPVIAHWTYAPHSSEVITQLIQEQKSNSIAAAALFLTLSIIFCFVFAYSGGSSILYAGYVLIGLCIGVFILALRLINAYYQQLAQKDAEVIFGEDCIYFIDELYTLQRGYHFLGSVTIYKGNEDCLLFNYGLYDVDEPPAYSVTVPIPAGKLHTAGHLRTYYMDVIKPLE